MALDTETLFYALLLSKKLGGGKKTKSAKDVNYYDASGNIVYAYSAEEFLVLTAHPTGSNVSKNGVALTFDEWNYTFSDAQTYVAKYGKLNIGGIYHPTDGKTHIFLNIVNSAYSDIDIRFTADSTATVDWGDGNTETVSGAFSGKHNYNDSGEFEITIDGSINIPSALLPNLTQAKYLTDVFLNDITSIGSYAFNTCSSLESVTIPESVKNISGNAFYACASLKSVTIPEGVTSISNNAFYLCSSLESIIIPEGVTIIAGYAFYVCASLKSVTIPESVKNISNNTFYACASLESITIPENVTNIGNSAFNLCPSLKSISIPEGVTIISNSAFYFCVSLKSIAIPEGVTSINGGAFNTCRNLVYVDISEATTIPTLDTSAFIYTSSLVAIIVPDNLYDDWIVATNWSEYASKIVKASEYIKPF